jgi:hypothetical protein
LQPLDFAESLGRLHLVGVLVTLLPLYFPFYGGKDVRQFGFYHTVEAQ